MAHADDTAAAARPREQASWREQPWRAWDVDRSRWDDWRWQAANAVRTVEELKRIVELTGAEERAVAASFQKFRMAITPHYAALMDPRDRTDPIWLQSIPSRAELNVTGSDLRDPLDEDGDEVVPGLVHRYPDRVLLLSTDRCALYCRYCTRRRLVGQGNAGRIGRDVLEDAYAYIAAHPQIRDVLISGGDPLVLSDARLEQILGRLRAIESVEIIRIGTRAPVVIPQRVTDDLCELLARYHPLYVNTHFNHPRELHPAAVAACVRLTDHGIPVGNQTVLLRGVNDSPATQKDLCHGLLRARVRPYYLYQCDLAEGLEHFRTPISRGIEIMESLVGHTTGFGRPTFVVDAPGGGGKIPVSPQYLVSTAPGKAILRNYEGRLFVYEEPERPEPFGHDHGSSRVGPASMLADADADADVDSGRIEANGAPSADVVL